MNSFDITCRTNVCYAVDRYNRGLLESQRLKRKFWNKISYRLFLAEKSYESKINITYRINSFIRYPLYYADNAKFRKNSFSILLYTTIIDQIYAYDDFDYGWQLDTPCAQIIMTIGMKWSFRTKQTSWKKRQKTQKGSKCTSKLKMFCTE